MSTATTWNSAGSTDANLAGNYSAGIPADAVITLNNTSIINWIFTANMSVESITIAATYSGNVSMLGFTLTVSLGVSFDGTGTYNLGNGITCNGVSSAYHIGAGAGSVTASSCVLTMNGTTGMTLDIDKAGNHKQLVLGIGAIVTSGGAVTQTFINTNLPLTLENNATFTLNNTMTLILTGTGTLYSIGIGCTFNGNGPIVFVSSGAASTATCPTLNYTGTGFALFRQSGAITTTFNFTGNISCAALNLSSNLAGATTTFNFGSYIHTVSSLIFVAAGTNNGNMQTSQWSVSGSITLLGTFNAGTSIVTITGTSTVTSNSKSFFDLTINAGANTVTCADALVCTAGGDLTLTAGKLNLSTFNLTVGGTTAINGTSTLNATASTCSFAGNYTTAAGATVTLNAATNYTFTAAAIVTTNGIALPQCTFNAAFSINDSCTISRLIWGIDGITGTFEATQTFTLTNLAAASWNGSAGLLNAVRSSIPGTQFTLAIPNIVTLQYINPRDADLAGGFQITVNDGTSVDGGNNDVNWIWPVVVPSTGGKGEGGSSRCYISDGTIGI